MALSTKVQAYRDEVGNIVKNPIVSSTSGKLLGYQDYVTGEQIIALGGATIDSLTPIPTGQLGEALAGAGNIAQNAGSQIVSNLPADLKAGAQALQGAAEKAIEVGGDLLEGRLPTATNAIDPLRNQLAAEEFTDAELAAIDAEFADLPSSTAPTDTVYPESAYDDDPYFEEDEEDAGDASYMSASPDGTEEPIGNADTSEPESTPVLNNDGEPTGAGDGEAPQAATGATPLPTEFISQIVPKGNPLDRFASYTYSISVYMINKPGLQRLQKGEKTVQGLPLLFQSGGSKRTAEGPDLYGATRSKFFKEDYYIDDVQIEGVISGASTQSINNQHTIKFKVTEPYGVTFLDNLRAAVKDYNVNTLGKKDTASNYISQMYLMVIRFYGYDIDGNIKDLNTLNSYTEINGVVQNYSEKYIPFIFTNVSFSLENDKVVYNCEAAAPMTQFGLNATHATLPFNVELKGSTVGEMLSDPTADPFKSGTFDNTRTDNNSKINTKTQAKVGLALAQALNQESINAYGEEYANHYQIVFEEGSDIEKKKIRPAGSVNKSQSASDTNKKPKNPNADTVDKQSKNQPLQAGTSIMKAIEHIVRNSEYIQQQQLMEIDENTNKPRWKDETNTQPLQWFKVVMQATPRTETVNPDTQDFAYDIVYKVKRYLVGDTGSTYFPPGIYRGVHKRYPYWFTGENTQVLNFRQDFNYLYYQQYAEHAKGEVSPYTNELSSDTVHITRRYYQPRAGLETGHGGRSGEPAASVASMLYSPADTALASMEIVGDPDWILQSEVFYGVDKTNNSPFEEDGSVNVNASEVYFSIEYKVSSDYDYNETGLLNPRGHDEYAGEPIKSESYRANTITSYFSNGKFTQQLEGTLMQWMNYESVTRVDGGLQYDPNKRKAVIEKRKQSQLLGIAVSEEQAAMLAAQTSDDDPDLAFTDEEIAAWQSDGFEQSDEERTQQTISDEDRAMNQGSLTGQTTVGGDDIAFNQGNFANSSTPTVNTTAGDDIAFNQGPVSANPPEDRYDDDFDDEEDYGSASYLAAPTDSTQPPLSNVAQAPVETPVNTDPASPREQSAPATPAPIPEVAVPVTTQTNPTTATTPEPAAEIPVVQTTQVTPRSLGTGETDITIPAGGQIDTVYENPTAFHDKGAVVGTYKGTYVEANTQGAMDAQVNAINTGNPVEYTDVVDGETQKWYYDPATGDTEFIGSLNPDTGKFE